MIRSNHSSSEESSTGAVAASTIVARDRFGIEVLRSDGLGLTHDEIALKVS